MKTIKNIFGICNAEKSMCNFQERIEISVMNKIRGGDGADGDHWPPFGTNTSGGGE